MNNIETKKLFRYFPTKSIFDSTPKAADANNNSYYDDGVLIEETPEVKWQDICFIERWEVSSYTTTQKIYTHGHLYKCGDVDDTISLTYALENEIHGLSDALDVANAINNIKKYINEDLSFVISSHFNELWERINDIEGNAINGVQIDGVDLVPDENKKVNIQAATNEDLGVVRVGDDSGLAIENGTLFIPTPSVEQIVAFLNTDFVDLGLESGTLWAQYNMGVNPDNLTNAEDWYGDFFAWGETEPRTIVNDECDPPCDWEHYKYANGAFNKLTKYCTNSDYGDDEFEDDIDVLEAEDDVVTTTLGQEYKIPTESDLRDLYQLPNKFVFNFNNVTGLNGRIFCRVDQEGVVAGNFNIIDENDLYFYDSEQDFGIWLSDYCSTNGLKYISSVSEFNDLLTWMYKNFEGYEGTADVTTMLFKDEEHTQLAIAGTDYTFGEFPDFDRSTMLFIPAAGYFDGSTRGDVDSYCGLWSSSLFSYHPSYAWSLSFDSGYINLSGILRCCGFSVRCVKQNETN